MQQTTQISNNSRLLMDKVSGGPPEVSKLEQALRECRGRNEGDNGTRFVVWRRTRTILRRFDVSHDQVNRSLSHGTYVSETGYDLSLPAVTREFDGSTASVFKQTEVKAVKDLSNLEVKPSHCISRKEAFPKDQRKSLLHATTVTQTTTREDLNGRSERNLKQLEIEKKAGEKAAARFFKQPTIELKEVRSHLLNRINVSQESRRQEKKAEDEKMSILYSRIRKELDIIRDHPQPIIPNETQTSSKPETTEDSESDHKKTVKEAVKDRFKEFFTVKKDHKPSETEFSEPLMNAEVVPRTPPKQQDVPSIIDTKSRATITEKTPEETKAGTVAQGNVSQAFKSKEELDNLYSRIRKELDVIRDNSKPRPANGTDTQTTAVVSEDSEPEPLKVETHKESQKETVKEVFTYKKSSKEHVLANEPPAVASKDNNEDLTKISMETTTKTTARDDSVPKEEPELTSEKRKSIPEPKDTSTGTATISSLSQGSNPIDEKLIKDHKLATPLTKVGSLPALTVVEAVEKAGLQEELFNRGVSEEQWIEAHEQPQTTANEEIRQIGSDLYNRQEKRIEDEEFDEVRELDTLNYSPQDDSLEDKNGSQTPVVVNQEKEVASPTRVPHTRRVKKDNSKCKLINTKTMAVTTTTRKGSVQDLKKLDAMKEVKFKEPEKAVETVTMTKAGEKPKHTHVVRKSSAYPSPVKKVTTEVNTKTTRRLPSPKSIGTSSNSNFGKPMSSSSSSGGKKTTTKDVAVKVSQAKKAVQVKTASSSPDKTKALVSSKQSKPTHSQKEAVAEDQKKSFAKTVTQKSVTTRTISPKTSFGKSNSSFGPPSSPSSSESSVKTTVEVRRLSPKSPFKNIPSQSKEGTSTTTKIETQEEQSAKSKAIPKTVQGSSPVFTSKPSIKVQNVKVSPAKKITTEVSAKKTTTRLPSPKPIETPSPNSKLMSRRSSSVKEKTTETKTETINDVAVKVSPSKMPNPSSPQMTAQAILEETEKRTLKRKEREAQEKKEEERKRKLLKEEAKKTKSVQPQNPIPKKTFEYGYTKKPRKDY